MVARVSNPPHPFESRYVEWEEIPLAELEVYEEDVGRALSENQSPDLPFRYSLNPYRGCFHACAYCYARPSHHYLGWGSGTDFDRKIVVKRNIVALLRRELQNLRPPCGAIAFSGVTDCYQPVEALYRLTRACLALCLEHRVPVSIISKSLLLRRDLDLLQQMAAEGLIDVHLSIAFARDAERKRLEPFASPIDKRFETLELLAAAGVPVGVALSPLIPGLNEADVPEILTRAKRAGATYAWMTLLRVSKALWPVFEERMREAFPMRCERVFRAMREFRGGALHESAFGKRMRGEGPRFEVVEGLFEMSCRRLGLERRSPLERRMALPREERVEAQLSLGIS